MTRSTGGFEFSRRAFLLSALASTACRTPPAPAPAPSPIPPQVDSGASPSTDAPADLLIVGGTILTHADDRPQVRALAMRGGVVIAIDDAAQARGLRGPKTEVVDLRGGLAVPGLTDAHAHLVGLGQTLEEVDLRGAVSVDEVVARLRAKLPPTGWIVGRGWDQNLWPGAKMPTEQALSQAFPDRPVWLTRVDGHAGWGNQALLRLAGIDRRTKAPAGGEILRDRKGNPTGVLVDAAMGLVPQPEPGPEQCERFIAAASQHVLARGLTGVHEMGIGPNADAAYRALAKAGKLPVRIHAYAAESWFDANLLERTPDPIEEASRYVLAGVKVYADGALGSRGAALLEPYRDRPDHRGLMQHDAEALDRIVGAAVAKGWQVATHAIGDAANRKVLDAYAGALQRTGHRGGAADPRLRIEHCQIVSPEDIPRFAQLGVIASMQPTHATSDMGWVPERIGTERLAGAYAWQRFLQAGVHLCFGSDFPVELADVTHGLYAAITRRDARGNPPQGWLPDQRVDLRQALRAFSTEAAYAAHRERHLGRLLPGYRGDVTCFAEDLLEASPEQIRGATIAATVVDGAIAYGR